MARTLPNNIVVGRDWTAPVPQAKSEWQFTTNGNQITVYYRDVWTNNLWKTRIPTIMDALGFDADPASTFFSATARQITPGVLCEVQLICKSAEGGGGGTPPLPDSTISENGASVRESILNHPNFTAASGSGTPSDDNSPWEQWWNYQTGQFDPSTGPADMPDYLKGLTDYNVGASTITVVDWFDSEPGDVEPDLGKIATPPGKSSGYYLLITGGKNPSGIFWQRRLVYQYTGRPVPNKIYSSA